MLGTSLVEPDRRSPNFFGRIDLERWDNQREMTVLVARKDKSDISANQVEALVGFCWDVLLDRMVNSISDIEREQIYNIDLDPSKFADYFETLRARKLSEGDITWVDERCPCDT